MSRGANNGLSAPTGCIARVSQEKTRGKCNDENCTGFTAAENAEILKWPTMVLFETGSDEEELSPVCMILKMFLLSFVGLE